MKPIYAPKFISTIAALSLCVSSAVANHSAGEQQWTIVGGSNSQNHTGNDSNTTTITNLTGGFITTGDNAQGQISSLIIQQESNNDGKPTLKVGSDSNNNRIEIPSITIGESANLARKGADKAESNILIQGGTTITDFTNNGVISSENKHTTIHILTNEDTDQSNGSKKGGKTVIDNFTNNGTIESKNNSHAIKIEGAKITNFTNNENKVISAPSWDSNASGNAILIHGRDMVGGESTGNAMNAGIDTFINKGTIESKGGGTQNTHGNTGENAAIKVIINPNKSNSQHKDQTIITTFKNSGTISSEHDSAIWLENTHIATFVNESGGIIESKSTIKNDTNDTRFDAAIYIGVSGGPRGKGTTIQSFDNKGTIKGRNAGIYIWGDKKQTITHFKNSGLIEVTNNGNSSSDSSGNNITAGIKLGAYGKTSEGSTGAPVYHTFENTGIIRGGQYGIHISGGTIENLKNSGTIEGSKDGIAFYKSNNVNDQNNRTLEADIKNITITSTGVVKGSENGINISKDKSDKDSIILTNINIEQGATVEGTSGSGLVLGKSENGQSQDKKYQIKGKIQVDGTLKGATAITNYGELGTDGQEAIVIGSTGQIQGGFKNDSKGTFKGNITNNSSHNLEIDNKGKVGNQTVITNKGSGNIEIKDWKLEKQDNNGNALKALKFEGDGGGKITLEKLTVDVTNADVSNENLKAAFQGNKMADAIVGTQVVAGNDNGAVSFSGDLLRGLVANIDGSKTAAAALNRTLIATATARATFLDTVMGNALNTLSFLHHRASSSLGSYKNANLYANATTIRNDLLSQSSSYASNKNNLFFVLPYYSYTKVELDRGVFSKGHTQGLVLGYSFFNPKSDDYYGIYIGYDDFSAHSQYFTLDNKTYFAGLKYYNPLTPSPNKQAYVKINAQAGLIKNNMTQKGDVEYSGTPATYAYALSSDIGVHLKVAKSVFSPELGIGYEGGFTPKYALTNTQNTYARITNTHTTNLYKTRTQFSWFMDWAKYTKTLVNVGAEYTLNPQIANPRGTYTNMGNASYGEGKTKIDPLLAFLGANLAIPLDERFYITFNYNTTFNSKLTQHTGYMKLNFMW